MKKIATCWMKDSPWRVEVRFDDEDDVAGERHGRFVAAKTRGNLVTVLRFRTAEGAYAWARGQGYTDIVPETP